MFSVLKLTARPERTTYRSGEVMSITAKVDYANPPIDGYFVVRGAGIEWKTNPVRDLQVPLIRIIPVQIPYCTVVEGVTVTGYKVPCPSDAVPVNGPVKFTVEFRDLNGRVLARDSFTVTIKGTAGELAEAPAEEKKGIPWWLLAGAAAVLLSGD